MTSECCIYALLHVATMRAYVGSSRQFSKRRRAHLRSLLRGAHDNAHLQRAWNKYGANGFLWWIVEVVADPERLLEREQWWLSSALSLYNIAAIAGRPPAFAGHSVASKAKISTASKARVARGYLPPRRPVGWKFSDAARLNLSRAVKEGQKNKPPAMLGRRHSESTREKQRQAALRRYARQV